MARVNYKPRPRQPVRERPARKPLRPANDNSPVANDNFNDALQEAVDLAQQLRRSPWLNRIAPVLKFALNAKELYDLYKEANEFRSRFDYGKWVKVTECAFPGGYVGRSAFPSQSCWSANAFPDWQGSYITPDETLQQAWNTEFWDLGFYPQPYLSFVGVVGGLARWQRPADGLPAPLPRAVPTRPLPNPNHVRNTPGIPVQPDPYDQPSAETDTPTEWQFASPSPNGDPSPHRRQPPGGTVKEGKYKSKAAALGVALYKALDDVSEWSETVDAIYGALPKSVRKRWERDRLAEQRDRNQFAGGLDQYGQYGIDGADWKLQALWYNWDKVDIGVAVENIIDNYIEDKVIGAYQKILPPQVVNALDQVQANGDKLPPEAVVSKMLKLIKEYLGLSYNPNMWMKGT